MSTPRCSSAPQVSSSRPLPGQAPKSQSLIVRTCLNRRGVVPVRLEADRTSMRIVTVRLSLTHEYTNRKLKLMSIIRSLSFLLTYSMFVGAALAQSESARVQSVRAKAEAGDIEAQVILAELCYLGEGLPRDYVESAKWYRKAAEKNNAKAQGGLGFLYEGGEGVPQSDSEAAAWYRKAADQGNAPGQYHLALMYAEGRGVSKSDEEALRLLVRSANQGYPSAQFKLGTMCAKGDVIPKDITEATKWYRKAAMNGHSGAQLGLAGAYASGMGVDRDLVEAYVWLKINEPRLNQGGKGFMNSIEQRLTIVQMQKAIGRISELLNQIEKNTAEK